VVLWHELAILASAGLVAWATWGGANPFGLWTFLLLWAMRVSAKLNLFLGVPNLGREFLPPHLAYMASWLRVRPMNLLFPLSVTGATATVLAFAALAVQARPESADALGHALLAALAFLALAEHWLMVLPLPSANLWSIYLGSRLRPDLPAQPAPLEASRP
jgi:putative photosynthetic complex assembly protein 2